MHPAGIKGSAESAEKILVSGKQQLSATWIFQLSVSGAWQDGGGTVVPWRAGSISETGARDGGYFRFSGILCRRPRG